MESGCPRREPAHPIPCPAGAVPRALNRGRGLTLTLLLPYGKDVRTAGQPASIPESLLRDVP